MSRREARRLIAAAVPSRRVGSKMKKIITMLLVASTVGGCGFGMYAKMPDLYATPWRAIEVSYVVHTNLTEVARTWSSTNQPTLDRLQQSLEIHRGGDLWGYSGSSFHKIQLEMQNGREFQMDISGKNQMGLNDYEVLKTGFHVELTSKFRDTLTTVIEEETGETPVFYHTPQCCEEHRNQ